jgi:urea transporter
MNQGPPAPFPSHVLLEALLADEAPPPSRLRRWLPSSGTLPALSEALGGGRPVRAAELLLRSLGQVIFLNNPLTGLLLLLALGLQSLDLAAFTLLGIVTANGMALLLGCERGALRDGIYGFNGALVGSGIGAFTDPAVPGSLPLRILLTLLGAAGSTLLVRHLGGWMKARPGLPVLTLPFCLVTWGLLAALSLLDVPLLALQGAPPPPPAGGAAAALLLALPRGFGQVFLCGGLWSGVLIAVAVAAASPIAAVLGLLGAASGALVGLLAGAGPGPVGMGLWSYNAVLTAIALGGTFHPPTKRSLAAALAAAAVAAAVTPLLARLVPAGLPVLTFPFVLTTLVALALLRRSLPSMVPVALHAIVTPEEHLRRYRITRHLLSGFRHRLASLMAGGPPRSLVSRADAALLERIERLFHELDHDGSGDLVVAELVTGLLERSSGGRAAMTNRTRFRQLDEVIRSMDLDGDGRVDLEEFTELMLRLSVLVHGRERLLSYVLPIDENGDGLLDPVELDRLLHSVGLPPLGEAERRRLFGEPPTGLAWDHFLDRLLLT